MSIRKQGAWGLWWLCGLTFGIYYLIWYGRINREICAVLGMEVPFDGSAISQFIPVLNLIGIVNTAGRLDAALQRVGSPERVSGGKALLSAFWFSSQTRYLQRRVNMLADVVNAGAQMPAPTMPMPPAPAGA